MESSLETRSVSDASTSSRAPFDAALSLALTLADHQGEANPQFRPTCTRPLMVSYRLQVDTNHTINRSNTYTDLSCTYMYNIIIITLYMFMYVYKNYVSSYLATSCQLFC